MSKIIKLSTPISHDGKSWDSLDLREVELGDMIAAEAMGGGNLAQMSVILSSISGVPVQAIKKMKGKDLNRIMDEAGALLGNAGEA
jgi:hypothetical protein